MSKTPEQQKEHSKKWNKKNPDYFKEYYKKHRKPEARIRGLEYCVRVVVKKDNPVYGLTIPTKLVEKHKLLGKVFKVRISPNGRFILYSETKKIPKHL
jgi:hypothetical protein